MIIDEVKSEKVKLQETMDGEMKRYICEEEKWPVYYLSIDERDSIDNIGYKFTNKERDKIKKAEKLFDEAQNIFKVKLKGNNEH